MKKSKGKYIAMAVCWLLVAACMGAIFFFSAQHAEESAELSTSVLSGFLKIFTKLESIVGHNFIRKLAHWTEYCGLGFLLTLALHTTYGKKRPVIGWSIAVIYAVTDEIHQLFVPGRACRVFDLLVDGFGAAVGVGICCAIIAAVVAIRRKNDKRKRL